MQSKVYRFGLIAAILCLWPAPWAWAQVDAVARPRDDRRLGFTVGGKVARVLVEPGDIVQGPDPDDPEQPGDLLVELEDDEGQALINLYQMRVDSDLAVRSAEAQLKLARIEEKATQELFENDAATRIEVERAQVKTLLAELSVDQVKEEQEQIQQQLRQAIARHARYEMRAPISGRVEQILIHEGEVVEELKPVLRLVVTDPLWVDAAVPIDQARGLTVGDPAWVRPKAGSADVTPVQGTIIFMAEVADPGSGTRLVRVETPNADGQMAGSLVTVEFTPPAGVSETTADATGTSTSIASQE